MISIVELNYELIRTQYDLIRNQLILDHIINNTPNITPPSADNVKDIDRVVLESLQKKYSDMGISILNKTKVGG